MKVVTLDQNMFLRECEALATAVRESGCSPDFIVGIYRGGSYVAKALARFFPEAALVDIELHRRHTFYKDGFFRGFLQRLPVSLQDFLRMAESTLRALVPYRKPRPVELPPEVSIRLRKNKGTSVLLIDDAVDSGRTMAMVYRGIASSFPEKHITTAAITVTTRRPLIQPDIALYNDKTLIRFPWSLDA